MPTTNDHMGSVHVVNLHFVCKLGLFANDRILFCSFTFYTVNSSFGIGVVHFCTFWVEFKFGEL